MGEICSLQAEGIGFWSRPYIRSDEIREVFHSLFSNVENKGAST